MEISTNDLQELTNFNNFQEAEEDLEQDGRHRPSTLASSRRMSSFHAAHSPKTDGGKNVTVVGIRGNFDDCQKFVKSMFFW